MAPTVPAHSPSPAPSSSRCTTTTYQPVSIESCGVSVSVSGYENNENESEHSSFVSFITYSATSTQWPFLLAGLLNNCVYVIILAVAKSLSEGGVGLVYTANIVPALVVKLTCPYWMYLPCVSSYRPNMAAAAVSAAAALLLLSLTDTLYVQLLGVALVSLQCGLGEATLLALAGKWDATTIRTADTVSTSTSTTVNDKQETKGSALTAFASGTGLAGPLGFCWTAFWRYLVGFDLHGTAAVSLVLPALYYWLYHTCLQPNGQQHQEHAVVTSTADRPKNDSQEQRTTWNEERDAILPKPLVETATCCTPKLLQQQQQQPPLHDVTATTTSTLQSTMGRFLFVASLYPYMIPLFAVYAAEYACQAGAWTAIGFPTVADAQHRDNFYQAAAMLYQVGVFFSRSSGNCFTVSMTVLWILPGLQVLNLVFFVWVAAVGGDSRENDTEGRPSWWWPYQEWLLLAGALYTGLLGGAVYVHGYKRIQADFDASTVELALAATSVAEGFGILAADVVSLFLQSCLYAVHDLPGAVVDCPLR